MSLEISTPKIAQVIMLPTLTRVQYLVMIAQPHAYFINKKAKIYCCSNIGLTLTLTIRAIISANTQQEVISSLAHMRRPIFSHCPVYALHLIVRHVDEYSTCWKCSINKQH